MTQSLSQFIKWYRENEEKISKCPWLFEQGDTYYPQRIADADGQNIPDVDQKDNEFCVLCENTMPDIVAALEEAKKIISSHDVKCEHPDAGDWCEKYFPSEEP